MNHMSIPSLVLAVLNDEDARIFTSLEHCADYVARSELFPARVLRIEDDVPTRDVSEDVARLTWDAWLARCDVFEDRAPEFLQRFLPDFDLVLLQTQREIRDERRDARNIRSRYAVA